jgi:fructose-1,6-bisphosphatase I
VWVWVCRLLTRRYLIWHFLCRSFLPQHDSAFATGEFVAVFDPIDGSKNIDSSLPVGSIFGIYKVPPGATVAAQTFLQDGHALVAAGYCLYSYVCVRFEKFVFPRYCVDFRTFCYEHASSSSILVYFPYRATTILVLTLGSGVDGFTLDPDTGKFLHTHRDIRIPSSGPIYSFNEANFNNFDEPVRKFLDALKRGSMSIGGRYAFSSLLRVLRTTPKKKYCFSLGF